MIVVLNIWMASMQWPDGPEAVCTGTNKKLVTKRALEILRLKYGPGSVDRGSAMCSARITSSDLRIEKIPFFGLFDR